MQPSITDGSGGLHPLVHDLADCIRASWADLPDLQPLELAADLESISGSLDGEKLFIRNELRSCRGLRKLHLEIARLGLGLQILHCVWFPDPRFDLPIFGADVVAGPAGISAAIVDLSPVGAALPRGINADLLALERPLFRQERALPGWGTIFSSHVCFIRPDGEEEESTFLDLVAAYLKVLRSAVQVAEADPVDGITTISRFEGQRQYCLQQRRNDKTRRVLEKAFNTTWADRYISELLFDDPPRPS
jgi:phycocyanobilin:ferredoxin oxidoreductase